MAEPEIQLTDCQVRQLVEFYDQHGRHEDKDVSKSIVIRSAPNLGGAYLEVATLDEYGQPTEKRVLFPT